MRLRMISALTLLTVVLIAVSACSAIAHHHEQLMSAVNSDTMANDPISGEWNVSFFVNGQTTPATFNLKLDGTKVTGTANSDHTGPGTIRDGLWENGKLTFTLDFKKHESIAITGKLQETKLVGEFHTEGFTANWEALKK